MPDNLWQEVIQEKFAHPSIPIAVIVNPANGPGWYRQSAFVASIQGLRSAKITVLGYVHTSYGGRNVNQVMEDVKLWRQWYNVNGIFYDEMAASASFRSYYQKIVDYAHSVGLRFIVGNPGERVSSIYMGMMNVLTIYENRDTPSMSSIQATTRGYARSNFAVLALDRSTLDWSFVFNAARYVGWIYITDGNLPNPYNALPLYFSALVSIVGDADGHYTVMAHPHALR